MPLLAAAVAALVAALAVASSSTAAPTCTVTWEGGASGAWNLATNWSGDTLPGPSSHVCIPAGDTVAVTTTVEVLTVQSQGTLHLNGGTLTLASTADDSVTAGYTQTSGTLTSSRALEITTSGTIAGGAMIGPGATRIRSGALVTMTGSQTLGGRRALEITGTLSIAGDGDVFDGIDENVVRVLAGGVLRKASGAADSSIGTQLDVDGRMEAASGILSVDNGSGDAVSTGEFGAATATGVVRFAGGTSVLGEGAAWRGGVRVAGGTVAVASGAVATATGANAMANGAIAGTGVLAVAGDLEVAGGAMSDTGVTRVEPGATVTQTGNLTLGGDRLLDIGGAYLIAGDADVFDGIGQLNAIRIRAGAALRKTQGSDVSSIGTLLDNDGDVQSDAGAVSVDSGSGQHVSAGRFGTSAATGTVRFSGGTSVLGEGAQWRGGVRIAGGAVTVAEGATVAATGENGMSSGSVGGPGTLEIGGPFAWSGGTHADKGTTRLLPGTTATVTGSPTLAGDRLLEIAGTLAFANDADVFDGVGEANWIHVLAGGAVRKTGGTTTTSLGTLLDNDGELLADTGALHIDNGSGPHVSSGAFGSAGAAGEVRFNGGTSALGAGAAWRGNVRLASGTVGVAAGATVRATGANAIASGTLGGAGTFEIAGPLAWTGGTMSDAGVTRIAGGATATMTGSPTLGNGRVLEIAGTLAVANDSDLFDGLGTTNAVHVLAGGALRKTAGAADSDIGVPLDNDGELRAATGTLDLVAGTAGETSTGDFGAAADGGGVRFMGATTTLGGGAEWRGGVTMTTGTLTIPAGATVVAGGANAITGGTLTGAGGFSVSGTLDWTGGTMTGEGATSVPAGATLTVPGAGGSVSVTGSRLVQVGGVLRVDGDRDIFGEFSGAAMLHVQAGGVLRKTAGTSSAVGVRLRNAGLVESWQGVLELERGAAATPHTGVFKGASATALPRLVGDDGDDRHVLADSVALQGDVEIGGDFAGGVVEVPAGATLDVGDRLALSGGVLTGAGTVAVAGTLNWRRGDMTGAGLTRVAAGGRLVAEGCFLGLDGGRRVENDGVLELLGHAQITASGLTPSEIRNRATLRIDDTGATSCSAPSGIDGDVRVSNAAGASITKLGTGRAHLWGTVENAGSIAVSGGTLELESGPAVVQTGAFTGTAPGRLVFDSGTFVLGDSATLSGDLTVDSARLEIPEGMTVPVPAGATLELVHGTVAGAGDLRVAGTLKWGAGTFDGPGTTVIEAGASATVGAGGTGDGRVEGGRSVVNRGTLTVGAGGMSLSEGGSLLNTGAIDVQAGEGLMGSSAYGYGYDALLHNTGTLRKTGAGAAAADVAIDNDGLIEVQGGELSTRGLLNAGSWFDGVLAGGAYTIRDGASLVLREELETLAAALTLDGPGAKLMTSQFTGDMPVDAVAGLGRITGAGALRLGGGRSLALTGGLQNAGVLALGAGSTLTAPAFGAGPASVLRVSLASATSAGRLAATGAAALGGRLDIVTDPAFSEPVGTEIPVVSAGSRSGAFGAVSGDDPAGPTRFDLVDGVRLRVAAPSLTGIAPDSGDSATLVEAGGDAAVTAEDGEQAARTAPADASPETAPADAPDDGAALEPVRIEDRQLQAFGFVRGRGVSVATKAGATLTKRAVTARSLRLVARVCRACGVVRVTYRGRALRTVSLKAGRRGRRVIELGRFAEPRRGTVRIRALSARRVAVEALLIGR